MDSHTFLPSVQSLLRNLSLTGKVITADFRHHMLLTNITQIPQADIETRQASLTSLGHLVSSYPLLCQSTGLWAAWSSLNPH